MKISSTKFLLILNLTGTIMIVSSSSWTSIWMGMELTSMTLPPLIVAMNSSIVSKINSWKYYMIQCYASSIFFMCVLCLSFSSQNWMYSNFLWLTIMFSMLFKMGIIPFHGWMYHLSNSISWPLFLILSTIQKIGPLIIISESYSAMMDSTSTNSIVSIMVSILSISGILTNSTRLILISSSMINSAWMIASTQVSKLSFLSFMMFYFIHLIIIFLLLENEYSNSLDNITNWKKENFSNELVKSILMMSLIGMPPLVGFFMKLHIMEQLVLLNHLLTPFLLSISSSIIMIMYLNISIMNINSMRMETTQNKPNLSLFFSVMIMSTCPIMYFSYGKKFFKMMILEIMDPMYM